MDATWDSLSAAELQAAVDGEEYVRSDLRRDGDDIWNVGEYFRMLYTLYVSDIIYTTVCSRPSRFQR